MLSLLNFFLEPKTILNTIPEAIDLEWKGGIWSRGRLEAMASHKLQKAVYINKGEHIRNKPTKNLDFHEQEFWAQL